MSKKVGRPSHPDNVRAIQKLKLGVLYSATDVADRVYIRDHYPKENRRLARRLSRQMARSGHQADGFRGRNQLWRGRTWQTLIAEPLRKQTDDHQHFDADVDNQINETPRVSEVQNHSSPNKQWPEGQEPAHHQGIPFPPPKETGPAVYDFELPNEALTCQLADRLVSMLEGLDHIYIEYNDDDECYVDVPDPLFQKVYLDMTDSFEDLDSESFEDDIYLNSKPRHAPGLEGMFVYVWPAGDIPYFENAEETRMEVRDWLFMRAYACASLHCGHDAAIYLQAIANLPRVTQVDAVIAQALRYIAMIEHADTMAMFYTRERHQMGLWVAAYDRNMDRVNALVRGPARLRFQAEHFRLRSLFYYNRQEMKAMLKKNKHLGLETYEEIIFLAYLFNAAEPVLDISPTQLITNPFPKLIEMHKDRAFSFWCANVRATRGTTSFQETFKVLSDPRIRAEMDFGQYALYKLSLFWVLNDPKKTFEFEEMGFEYFSLIGADLFERFTIARLYDLAIEGSAQKG